MMADSYKISNTSSEESLPLSQETYNSLWNMMDIHGRDEMVADITGIEWVQSELSPVPAVQPQPPDGAHVLRTRSSLPAVSNWPGNYDFKLLFAQQEKINKHITWTYSHVENKLYVRKDAVCPFSFQTNTLMPDNVIVRAMAVYSSAEHAAQAVTRCVNHSQKEIIAGKEEAEHLIRSDSKLAMYQKDAATNRHSVIVGFENPPVGQSYSTYIYRFVCFSSCAGGPNRRPLTLVFTLEQESNVLGRIALDLKICACPGRDRELAEKEKTPTSSNSAPPAKKSKVMEPNTLAISQNLFENFVKEEKLKQKSGDKKEFTIKVKDKDCYLFLTKMRRLYQTHKTLGSLSPECRALLHILRSSSDEDEKS